MTDAPPADDASPLGDSIADPRALIESWKEPADETSSLKLHRPRWQKRLTQEQLLTAPLKSLVLFLALPSLAEQMLIFLVGTVDMLLAGHLSGEGASRVATEAVGIAAYVGWLATMLFAAVGAGTTALVSRAMGAGDERFANQVANRSLVLSAITGLAMFGLLWTAAPVLASALDLTGEARQITINYLRLDAVGLIFASISLAGSAAMRGCGDMRTPMWILGGVNVINAILSPMCVYGTGPLPEMGVVGIVIGTMIARIAGGLAVVWCLAVGTSGLKLKSSELRATGDIAQRILSIGLPAAADGLIMWIGHFTFLRIVRESGEASLAAHFIGIRIEALTYLPAVAWGAATATLVGQSLGAKRPDRARQAANVALMQMVGVGLMLTVVYLAAAGPIFRAMSNDPEVCRLGAPALRMLALFQVPLTVAIVVLNTLRGAGETRFPMWVTLIGGFGIRLPLAWFCGIVLEGGLIGAWIGMCGDMLFRAVVLFARYLHGGWMHKSI